MERTARPEASTSRHERGGGGSESPRLGLALVGGLAQLEGERAVGLSDLGSVQLGWKCRVILPRGRIIGKWSLTELESHRRC